MVKRFNYDLNIPMQRFGVSRKEKNTHKQSVLKQRACNFIALIGQGDSGNSFDLMSSDKTPTF